MRLYDATPFLLFFAWLKKLKYIASLNYKKTEYVSGKEMYNWPVTTAECSSPQARWITASSRIQNLLSKKRLLPNVNTAPESATMQGGYIKQYSLFETFPYINLFKSLEHKKNFETS